MAFQEDRPQFLKSILEETLHDEKLLIPEEFGKEHLNGVSVPTNVILQVRSGSRWVAELSESNGAMWLRNGWKEFVEDLSLEHGQSVLFRYDGGCNFRVFVFAKSCEIKYPSSSRKRERSSPSQTRPSKNRRIQSFHLENEPETNSNREPKTADVKRGGESSNGFKHEKKYRPEHSLKSEKPHFKVEFSSDDAKELNIPAWFASKHLTRTGDVKLRVSDRKTWIVALSCTSQKPFTAKFIGLKWRAFVRCNNLQEGDVCVFEMIKSNVFKVTFLSTTGGRSCIQKPSTPETPEACVNTHKENPFFTKAISSKVDQCMYIPSSFGSEHLSGIDQVKLRVSDGRTWTVQIKFAHSASNTHPVAKFIGDSWRNFVMSNHFQEGGFCVFELIKGEGFVFNVSFTTSDVNRCPKTTSGRKSHPRKQPSLQTQQVCGDSFTKTVGSSWSLKQMRVPVEFTDNHIATGPGKDRDVILEVEGRSWEVKLSFSGRYGTFSTGWAQFADDNHLTHADVCAFKLIEGSDDIVRLKVTINKR